MNPESLQAFNHNMQLDCGRSSLFLKRLIQLGTWIYLVSVCMN